MPWPASAQAFSPARAAFAVLLVCLQLKRVGLGIAMVAAFSVGLAVTLVSIGIAAAWAGRKAAAHKNPAFSAAAHWLPYASAVIVIAVGSFIALRGLHGLGVLGA